MDYEKLRREYPAVITMEQMYRICHISKRKARWLLEHGVVPCEDSGKQTRRFRIRLDDVIDYLEKVETGALEVVLPVGAFSNGAIHATPHSKEPRCYLDCDELCDYILELWADAPDALTVQQAEELCGYNRNTLNKWFVKKYLCGVNYFGSNLISKESLAKYLSSDAGQSIVPKSEEHKAVLSAMSP